MEKEVIFYEHYMVWTFPMSANISYLKCIYCNRLDHEVLNTPRVSCLSPDEKIIKGIIE